MKYFLYVVAALTLLLGLLFWNGDSKELAQDPIALKADNDSGRNAVQFENDNLRLDLRNAAKEKLIQVEPALVDFEKILVEKYQSTDPNKREELNRPFQENAKSCMKYAQALIELSPEAYTWLLEEPWMEGQNSTVCLQWTIALGRLHESILEAPYGPYGSSGFDMWEFDRGAWGYDIGCVISYVGGNYWHDLSDDAKLAAGRLHEKHYRKAMSAYVEYKRWKRARFYAYDKTSLQKNSEIDQAFCPGWLSADSKMKSFNRSYLEDVRKFLKANGITPLR